MKCLLIILALVLSFSNSSKASHTLGGEIGWTCLVNGKYVFFMTTYMDCTGIPWLYETETITIYGSPLPKNASGIQFSTITMEPDSNRWVAERNGDTSPSCTNQYGNAYTCDNKDPGTVQQFFYRSAPITLAGNPSRAGWRFFWESSCCRPGRIENMLTPGPLTLRAEMFSTKNRDDKSPCIDSSPEFRSLPTTTICRGYEFTYNPTAIDSDLDSLVYSWDRPYNGPGEAPEPLVYKPGYAPDNPTPDTSFDSRNIPSTLNPLSGVVKMAVYSEDRYKRFYVVIKVDSYRDGVKISSIYREIPILITNCDSLPNGLPNTTPKIIINGDTTLEYTLTVAAGQTIKLPIEVIDNGYWDSLNTKQQVLSMQPEGLLFSRDRTIGGDPSKPGTPCQVTFGAGKNLIVEPCAYLQMQAPILDASLSPPAYSITDTGSIRTEFVWQTDCNHLRLKTGAQGTREGIYNFVFKVSDDHCPIPAINYPTITVRVKDPIPLTEPIMKGINVDLNGDLTYQWVPAIDSAFGFKKYIVERGAAVDGNPIPATNWNILNANLKDFQQETKDPNFIIFRNVILTDPTSPKNILNKLPNRDWYMRMTAVSGCTNDVESIKSDQVRVMELDVEAFSDSSGLVKRQIKLAWNSPKADGAGSYDYFQYESKTRYYIWQCDSLSLSGLSNSLNWYLRDSTYNNKFTLLSNSCNNFTAFRIQARDTVVTWKRGNAPNASLDSSDTLTFSTYSVIDTVFLSYAQPIVQRIGVQVLNSNYPADSYQWIDCNADSLIINANSRELQLSDVGSFAVITSNGNCIDTSNCFTVTVNLNDSIILVGKDTLKSLDYLANYQWYNCGNKSIIQGAINQTYVLKDTGYYAVIVSVFGYSDTSTCYPYFPLGIQKQGFSKSISIYPNPTSGEFKLVFGSNIESLSIRLYNLQGQVVSEQNVRGQKSVDLNILGKPGIYFIQLTNEKGERANFKIIKQ